MAAETKHAADISTHLEVGFTDLLQGLSEIEAASTLAHQHAPRTHVAAAIESLVVDLREALASYNAKRIRELAIQMRAQK